MHMVQMVCSERLEVGLYMSCVWVSMKWPWSDCSAWGHFLSHLPNPIASSRVIPLIHACLSHLYVRWSCWFGILDAHGSDGLLRAVRSWTVYELCMSVYEMTMVWLQYVGSLYVPFTKSNCFIQGNTPHPRMFITLICQVIVLVWDSRCTWFRWFAPSG